MSEKLRIAQVAPLAESVPPHGYGGTERVVSYLTEELVRLGHDVTLFASGDSKTRARLRVGCSRALRLDKGCVDPLAPTIAMLEEVTQAVEDGEFDVVHSHLDYLPYSMARRTTVPVLTTLHGRQDIPELQGLYHIYRDVPLVSISDAQRLPLPQANWVQTVYHGLPLGLSKFNARPQRYLAFLGRVSPEKCLESAIRIAKATQIPLKIAAKVSSTDELYYKSEIKPLLDDPLIEFLGELCEVDKGPFLANALALIFMVDWPEPFGLAMIEAMACGTPVIARRRGSIPEVVDEGVTGFVCDDEDQAVTAVHKLEQIDRARCRSTFERRFSDTRMTQDYVQIYQHLVHGSTA